MKQLWYYLLMAAVLCMVYMKSGAQQIATDHYIKIIRIDSLKFDSSMMIFKNKPIDTPRVKLNNTGIVFFNDYKKIIGYQLTWDSQGFAVHDTTGIIARRDSMQQWIIKDAARSLEVMYQLFIKKYEMRKP